MKRHLVVGLILVSSLFLVLTAAVRADGFKSMSIADRAGPGGEAEYVPGEVLVKFKMNVTEEKMAEVYDEASAQVISEHRGGVKKLRVRQGSEQEVISSLARDPRVEYAELNSVCHAHLTPNDPYYSYQWSFPKINMEQAWDISTGQSVVVGILDSGIAYEDYAVPSYERGTVQSGVTQYVRAPELSGTSFTAGYDFINNDTHPNDNCAHGTHVAGTAAQTTNNSQGVAGMAFDCVLMPVKVLDYSGSGTAQSLADGLYWATDHGAQVINMSLGWTPGYNPGSTVANAIAYAYNHGVVLLASSGNAGVGVVSYPAAYSQVIAVGATRYDDNRPSYSQYGSALEICACGGDMTVDQTGDGYGDGTLQMTFLGYNPGPPEQLADPTDMGYWFYDGTSMACPHGTALVAMMIANGQTGVENIRTILHETAVDLGAAGWDQYYGYGRIDAHAALSYGGTPPVAEFSGSPTSGCAPLTVSFTDLTSGEVDTWDWDFGDGGSSGARNPDHQYSNPGDYTVSLTVTGPNGSDTETKTNYISVEASPAAAFTGSPTSGCAPLTVNFINQSTGGIGSYDWDFGDGGSSTAQNPSHQYTGAGTYTVSLSITGPCGSDSEVKTDYITVGETLVADFYGTPTSGCAPLVVGFTDASTGEVTSYDWNFGDGGTSTLRNPTHQYGNPGNYTVTLTVTGDCGSDAETKTNYVHVDGPPFAAFSGTPTSGDYPLTVGFTDQSSGQVASYDWDFGDGGSSSAENPVHEYTAAGDYTVTLTVTGPCGSDAEIKADYIHVTEPSGWTVITYDDFEGGWGNYMSGGSDCFLYTGGSYAHQGSNAADIQDNSGAASSFCHSAGYDVSGYADLEVEFWYYAVSMDNSREDFWLQYYDGSGWQTVATYARSIDFENNVFYHEVVSISSSQYDFPSNAGLRFMCDASGNADDVYIDEIEWRGSGGGGPLPPEAAFEGSPTMGVVPFAVNFTDQSTGTIGAWSWDFGDGGSSSAQNPAHEYTSAGVYTVTLTVTGPGGSDEEVKTDYITASEGGAWAVITYDDFEGGWGSYADGGGDCYLYTDGAYAHQGSNAADIQDNSGTASSFYHTTGHDVTGYTELEVEFWFYAVSMDNSREDFWLQYYDGSAWETIATYARSIDFDNNVFYNKVVTISRAEYAFPADARLRFMCDASGNTDDVYIDEIEFRGMTAAGSAEEVQIFAGGPEERETIPSRFSVSHSRPNPFHTMTEFSISLPQAARVTTEIFTMQGQKVATLTDEVREAGTHVIRWDGTNSAGQPVASGIYFYRVIAGGNMVTKKMVLTR
jgi:serine protease